MSTESRPVLTPKFVLGCFVLAAGILLTVDSLGLLDTSGLFRFWPVALIAMGVVTFFQPPGSGSGRTTSGVLMLVGGVLLLSTFGFIEVEFWELFWPVVLIVAGASFMMQALRREHGAPPASESVTSFAMMAGVKRTIANRFRHADLGSIWGGCDLDLRRATIPPGEEAVVEVFALMGGHKIVIPEEWMVDSRVFALMGGVDDRTTPPKDASAPRLVVHGAIIMGGLHLRN